MDNAFLAEPRRGRTRVMVGLTGLALVLGAVVALRVAGGDAAPMPPSSGGPVAASDAGEDPETVTEPLPAASASRSAVSTVLVPGEHVVSGVRVGYPHTEAGMVSAAFEYAVQFCSTLDLDRAAEIGPVIADTSFGDSAEYFRQGRANNRRALGWPETGPLPAGASQTLSPVEYQVREQGSDRAMVLLLGYLVATKPGNQTQSSLGVFPFPMAWSAGDWKISILPANGPDYTVLWAQPGTSKAAALGWRALSS